MKLHFRLDKVFALIYLRVRQIMKNSSLSLAGCWEQHNVILKKGVSLFILKNSFVCNATACRRDIRQNFTWDFQQDKKYDKNAK